MNHSYRRVNSKLKLLYSLLSLYLFYISVLPATLFSDVKAGGFVGFSGTSLAIFLLESLSEEEDVVEASKEFGLFTGESGLAIDIGANEGFGVRFESLYGYYKYRVIDLPNTAYTMFLVGVEPYIKSDNLIFGAGYGRFWGVQWDEILGQKISGYRDHAGIAYWTSIAYHANSFELNARIRHHNFTQIDYIELQKYGGNDYEDFENDIIFVLRLLYWL